MEYVAVNEKIYIFIWFWFLALSLLSFIVVLYRFIIIFSPYIRAYVLRMRFRWVKDTQCWSAKPGIYRRVKKECIDAIIGRSYVGDWLLFYLLGQNIDSGAYKVAVHCALIKVILIALRMLFTSLQRNLATDLGTRSNSD